MTLKVLVLFSFCLLLSFGMLRASSESDESSEEKSRISFCAYDDDQEEVTTMDNRYYRSNHITYKITKYSKKLRHSEVKAIIAKAFETWSNVTDLTFTRKRKRETDPVDIDIRFETGAHGCVNAFDGPSSTLAHAGYGHIHFDETERWSKGIDNGVINLYLIAVHEIGHALGLHHSYYKDAIMYKNYDSSNPVTKLHTDDIKGIQLLYGEKNTCDDTSSADCSGQVYSDDTYSIRPFSPSETFTPSYIYSPSNDPPSTDSPTYFRTNTEPTYLPLTPSYIYSPSNDPPSTDSPKYFPTYIAPTYGFSPSDSNSPSNDPPSKDSPNYFPTYIAPTYGFSPSDSNSPSNDPPSSDSPKYFPTYIAPTSTYGFSPSDSNSPRHIYTPNGGRISVYRLPTISANSPSSSYSLRGTYSPSDSNSPSGSYKIYQPL